MTPESPGSCATLSFADFKKCDLRVARVLEVREHPDADRLWIIKVDLGQGQTKEVVAGIKQYYPKEKLENKNIILVNNLEPAVIRGVASNGMILAAKDQDRLTILTTDLDVPAGTRVS